MPYATPAKIIKYEFWVGDKLNPYSVGRVSINTKSAELQKPRLIEPAMSPNSGFKYSMHNKLNADDSMAIAVKTTILFNAFP